MKNKLGHIVIENPRNMSAGYMLRDTLISLATLLIWSLCMTRLYLFLASLPNITSDHAAMVMLKLLATSFCVTLAVFHAWAIYNRWLHWRQAGTQTTSAPVPVSLANATSGESRFQGPGSVNG